MKRSSLRSFFIPPKSKASSCRRSKWKRSKSFTCRRPKRCIAPPDPGTDAHFVRRRRIATLSCTSEGPYWSDITRSRRSSKGNHFILFSKASCCHTRFISKLVWLLFYFLFYFPWIIVFTIERFAWLSFEFTGCICDFCEPATSTWMK